MPSWLDAVEGGGGDNLAVAHSNELFLRMGMEPIDGSFLSTLIVTPSSSITLKGVTGSCSLCYSNAQGR